MFRNYPWEELEQHNDQLLQASAKRLVDTAQFFRYTRESLEKGRQLVDSLRGAVFIVDDEQLVGAPYDLVHECLHFSRLEEVAAGACEVSVASDGDPHLLAGAAEVL